MDSSMSKKTDKKEAQSQNPEQKEKLSELEQKKKRSTYDAMKRGTLSNADFGVTTIQIRMPRSRLLGSTAADSPGVHWPQVKDIHDHDAADTIYGWDFDGTDGYVFTNPDPMDPIWGGTEPL